MILEEAIDELNKSGLVCDRGKLPQAYIIGGTAREKIDGEKPFWVYQEAFFIYEEGDRYFPRVAGPGQRSVEGSLSSLEDAVKFVIDIYRDRQLIE